MRRENARAGYHKENPYVHLRTRCVSPSPLLSSQQDALSSLETSICPLEREEVHCHCSGAALAALASWGRCQLCRRLSCSCWLSRCRALCAQGTRESSHGYSGTWYKHGLPIASLHWCTASWLPPWAAAEKGKLSVLRLFSLRGESQDCLRLSGERFLGNFLVSEMLAPAAFHLRLSLGIWEWLVAHANSQ